MKHALFFLLLVSAWVNASTTLQLKEGWQLVGIPTGLENMNSLERDEVALLWAYDAATASWKGFSPDENTTAKMTGKGINPLYELLPYQAVWIKSTRNWSYTLPESVAATTPKNDVLELKKGWNLVALPQRSVISPELFGNAVVWKYGDEWEAYGVDEIDFPNIDTISTSEGFWVKSTEERTIDMAKESAKLHTFNTTEEMTDYIRTMLNQNDHYYYYTYDYNPCGFNATDCEISGAPDESETSGMTDATSTNLQEEGVDESDILKHDGTHIFYVDSAHNNIIITTFENITLQNYTPIETIALEENQKIQAMYLHDNKLTLVSYTYHYYILEGDLASGTLLPSSDENIPTFQIDILDVSDLTNIHKVASHVIEGHFKQSRMIDGRLYIISSFWPYINYGYPKIYQNEQCATTLTQMSELSCTTGFETYDCSDISEIPGNATSASYSGGVLPGDSGVGALPGSGSTTGSCSYIIPIVDETCQAQYDELENFYKNNCRGYYYTDENGSNYVYDYENPYIISEILTPSKISGGDKSDLLEPQRLYAPYKLDQLSYITTISAFDTTTGTYDESISYLGNPATYYASSDALYLVSNEYPLYYNFDYNTNQSSIYKFAFGDTLAYRANGTISGAMLNQFSMSEQNGILRTATTTGSSWSPNGTQNTVYALQENNTSLDIIGQLDGLGKAGESIYAARFIGNRGFVVTFRNTDPLYTIDLSDPTQIAKVGELEIPGYSEYFHPVSETQILSVGRDSQLLQVQLFDISDFSNPRLSDKITIGDSYAYSEAEQNHKAFIYRDSDQSFGFPYRTQNNGSTDERLGIYRIVDDSIVSLKTLNIEGASWNTGETRGMIFDYNNLTYGAMFKSEHILSGTIE